MSEPTHISVDDRSQFEVRNEGHESFGFVYAVVMQSPDISRDAKFWYAMLSSYANQQAGNKAWPGMKTLIKVSGMSKSSVIRGLDAVVAEGLATRKRRPVGNNNYKSTVYTMIHPEKVRRRLESRGLIPGGTIANGDEDAVQSPSVTHDTRTSKRASGNPVSQVEQTSTAGDTGPVSQATPEQEQENRAKNREVSSKRRSLPVEDVRKVFDAWVESPRLIPGGRKRSRARMDSKRRQRIEDCIRDYDIETALAAVRGWVYEPFNRGQNEKGTRYDDIELLLRDAKRIEKFAALYDEHQGQPVTEEEWRAAASGGKPNRLEDEQAKRIRDREEFRRLQAEHQRTAPHPDDVVIDGGEENLSA